MRRPVSKLLRGEGAKGEDPRRAEPDWESETTPRPFPAEAGARPLRRLIEDTQTVFDQAARILAAVQFKDAPRRVHNPADWRNPSLNTCPKCGLHDQVSKRTPLGEVVYCTSCDDVLTL